ncbi:MAG: cardiolipin synthase, partial [bacterium]
DGIAATVGTINFDYRSLYLHFENNIILYKTASLEDIKADFVNLEGLSVEVPRVEGKRFTGVFEAFMRLLSPLL